MIGPGRLILVVGPSGAGKDTLIAYARLALRDDADVIFPRRMITRPASPTEDHDTLAVEAFDQAVRAGAFALHWEAHGHKYAIPASIDDDLRAQRTVICNVSRTIVNTAREHYAAVVVALVTAPRDILWARLASRGRASDGNLQQRILRTAVSIDDLRPDFVIRNIGHLDTAVAELVSVAKMPR
jgi:ribose 1,5-bisphosphokinase